MVKTVKNCARCGKKFGFEIVRKWSSQTEATREFNEQQVCGRCYEELKNIEEKAKKEERYSVMMPVKGMKYSEYRACIDNLGLLEGEEIKLRYVCFRHTIGAPSIWDGQRSVEQKKGLLVFTNDNMIFMQQEGAWSSNYSQALRFPLEEISGISEGGTFIKRLRILVGTRGSSEYHEFMPFAGQGSIGEIRHAIEALLTEVRKEKKRLAQEALAKGTVPALIFCKFCGTRNKADQSHCVNCGAPLT